MCGSGRCGNGKSAGFMRVTQRDEVHIRARATTRPRYAPFIPHLALSADVYRSSMNYNARVWPGLARVYARARKLCLSCLSLKRSVASADPGPPRWRRFFVARREDIRFAFDDHRWCRNPRHSFARSRNAKWPRTWLRVCIQGHAASMTWPMNDGSILSLFFFLHFPP